MVKIVKMFVSQIWENIRIKFDNFGGNVTRLATLFVFKSRVTFDTSSWVVFLNKITDSRFLFLYVKNTRVFFKYSNNSWENVCVSLGKTMSVLGIFKSETTFEKKLLKTLQVFLSSEICFSA